MVQVLACGAAIVTLSMGIRHGFGLWLQPITQAQNWTRETFALAIAIQNISWGVAGIFAGMVADRFGAFRVIIVGALFYAAGPGGHGPRAHAAAVRAERGRADRHCAGRHHLRRGLRRDRAQRAGRPALVGHGHHGGGRLFRAVPDGAGRGLPDQLGGLATGAGVPGRSCAAHGAAGLLAARARLWRRRGAPSRTDHHAGAARGVQVPELPAC